MNMAAAASPIPKVACCRVSIASAGRDVGRPGRAGLDALLEARGVDVVTFRDWKKIEEAEIARAREGAPREKFVAVEDMIAARG